MVHGAGGPDELSLAGENFTLLRLWAVASVRIQYARRKSGLPYCPVERLQGGTRRKTPGSSGRS